MVVDLDWEFVWKCVVEIIFEKLIGCFVGSVIFNEKICKGVIGDWWNYFMCWDGELFVRYGGGVCLIEFGYEIDDDWIDLFFF